MLGRRRPREHLDCHEVMNLSVIARRPQAVVYSERCSVFGDSACMENGLLLLSRLYDTGALPRGAICDSHAPTKENIVRSAQAVVASCLLVEFAREDALFYRRCQPLRLQSVDMQHAGPQSWVSTCGKVAGASGITTYHADRPIAVSSRWGRAIGRPGGTTTAR